VRRGADALILSEGVILNEGVTLREVKGNRIYTENSCPGGVSVLHHETIDGVPRISGMTRIPFTLRYLAQFAALAFLCLAVQELAEHLLLRAACGTWGTVGFGAVTPAAGCAAGEGMPLAVGTGPVLAWLMIWGGLGIIRHGQPLAGITVIMANLPLGRVVEVLFGGGDELAVARGLVPGNLLWLPTLVLVLALVRAPLATSYRALGHPRRAAILTTLLVIPVVWDGLFTRTVLPAAAGWYPAAIAGVPVVFVAVCAAAVAALALLGRREVRDPELAMISGQVYAVSVPRWVRRGR
jgi:hypothetical protein